MRKIIREALSDESPYFFMKEFSNDELANLLINKVKELKEEKKQSQDLNTLLQQNVSQLEETTAQLEETKEELQNQRDNLAEEVRKKSEELVKKERLAAIGELSARIAHDLRNPISIAKNTAELLKIKLEKSVDPKTLSQLERLERSLYRITHQVDDVLDFVKETPLKKSNNSLAKILKNSLERIQLPKNITVKHPQTKVTLPCDAEKLEVVFVNLTMNAIQAMDEKPGMIVVKVSDDPDDDNFVLIEFRDNGPGIPHELAPKIFDLLFTTRQIGTGLGLPSCKNIIEKHGGTIEVKNTKKGAAFLIRLPKKSEWESISSDDKEDTIKAAV